jgi:hypothetical protein
MKITEAFELFREVLRLEGDIEVILPNGQPMRKVDVLDRTGQIVYTRIYTKTKREPPAESENNAILR